MDGLGGLEAIAPARIAGEPGSNPGPGDNCFLKVIEEVVLISKRDAE